MPAALAAALFLCAACSTATPAQQLRIGAMFPLAGSAKALAGDEYRGAQIAAQLVNATGGVGGKQIALDMRDV